MINTLLDFGIQSTMVLGAMYTVISFALYISKRIDDDFQNDTGSTQASTDDRVSSTDISPVNDCADTLPSTSNTPIQVATKLYTDTLTPVEGDLSLIPVSSTDDDLMSLKAQARALGVKGYNLYRNPSSLKAAIAKLV